MLDTVVDELHKRLQQAKDAAPADLLENRWLHLGLALVIGYAIGRTRARVQLGPFGRTLATAAVSTLVRTAMQAHDRNANSRN
jgi:hypothetical protein